MGTIISSAQVASADTNPNCRTPEKEPKEILRRKSRVVEGLDCVYQVPVHGCESSGGDSFLECTVGEPSNVEEKVVLLLGQTGSGKTTTTNWLLNYIYGVNYQDGYRFQVVAPSDSDESDTKNVNIYTFHHQPGLRIPYTLTIIDTPGFLSTGKLTEDRAIRNRLSKYFEANESDPERRVIPLHAACILVKASATKLTAAEEYVFQCITQIFGNNIEKNIIIFFTFADQLCVTQPAKKVVDAAKLPYQESFFFNNGDVLRIGEGVGDDQSALCKIWWKSGEKQTAAFFRALGEMEAKTSKLTQQTLEERRRIELSIIYIKDQIKSGCHTLLGLNDLRKAVELNKAKIDKKRDFKFKMAEEVITEEPIANQQATVCRRCKFTCHEDCHTNDKHSRARCIAMDLVGNCRHCPKNCHVSYHTTANFTYKRTLRPVEKSSEDLIRMFSDTIDGIVATPIPRSRKILMVIKDPYMKNALGDILKKVTEIQDSLVKLKEVAMVPAPQNPLEYVDILIETEKNKRDEGYLSRIKELEYVKEQYKMLDDIQNSGR